MYPPTDQETLMELTNTTLQAFKDELDKIAGFSRSGIRPFKASTLAGRAGKFVKKTFMKKPGSFMKQSGVSPKMVGTAALSGAALGIYGQHKLKQVAQDYQTGRMVRKSQEGRQ